MRTSGSKGCLQVAYAGPQTTPPWHHLPAPASRSHIQQINQAVL